MSSAEMIASTTENQLGNQSRIILGQATAPILKVGADLQRQVKSIQTFVREISAQDQGVSRTIAQLAGSNHLAQQIDEIKQQLAPLGRLPSAFVQERERMFQAHREWLSPYAQIQKEIKRLNQAWREAVRVANFFPFHIRESLKQFLAPVRLADHLRSSFSPFTIPRFPRIDVSAAIKEMVLPSWWEQFREQLPRLLRQLRRETCKEVQAAVLDGNPEEIDAFCEELGLKPHHYRIAVAETLWEGRWIQADNPLAYVATVAARKVRRQRAELNGSMFGSRLVSLDVPVSLDTETFPRHTPIPSPQTPLAEVEVNRDFERACLFAGLSPDTTVIARLYYSGGGMISRQDLPVMLHWSRQRTEAALRDFQRKRERLKKFLGIYKR